MVKTEPGNITFGSDPVKYESVHQHDYKRVVGSSEDRLAFKENSKYLRAAHFELGTSKRDVPTSGKGGETASKDAYRDPGKEFYKNYMKEQAEKGDKKAALQRANFTLGCDEDRANLYKSIHSLEICEPANLPREKNKLSGKDETKALRSHSFSLGSDRMDYTSTISAAHVHFTDVDRGPDIRERTRALRKSSFSFGTDNVDYQSASRLAFTDEGVRGGQHEAAEDPGTRGVNFKVGNDPVDWDSESRRSYSQVEKLNEHCRNPTRLDPQQLVRLRSHNFNFGTDVPVYQSLGQQSFGAKQVRSGAELAKERENMEHIKKDLRATHITLGAGNRKLEGITASRSAYLAPSAKALRASQEDRGQIDTGVHFTLGTDDEELKRIRCISLAQDSMQAGVSGANLYTRSAMDQDVKDDLRKCHFYLGTGEGAAQWKSTSSANYVAHKDAERMVMSEAVKKDLRASHYQLGGEEGYSKDMKSTQQEAMSYFGPAPKDEEEERSSTTNFVLGNSNIVYQSTAGAAYSWPGGKKPK